MNGTPGSGINMSLYSHTYAHCGRDLQDVITCFRSKFSPSRQGAACNSDGYPIRAPTILLFHSVWIVSTLLCIQKFSTAGDCELQLDAIFSESMWKHLFHFCVHVCIFSRPKQDSCTHAPYTRWKSLCGLVIAFAFYSLTSWVAARD